MVRARKYIVVVKVRGGWFKLNPLTTNMDEEQKHFDEILARLQEGNPNDLILARKIKCTNKEPEDVVRAVNRKFNANSQNGWLKAKITLISAEIREQCKK